MNESTTILGLATERALARAARKVEANGLEVWRRTQAFPADLFECYVLMKHEAEQSSPAHRLGAVALAGHLGFGRAGPSVVLDVVRQLASDDDRVISRSAQELLRDFAAEGKFGEPE